MQALRSLLGRLDAERLGWFGAGLSAAAVGLIAYQFFAAAWLAGALPGPQPVAAAQSTERPTPSPYPTRTPYPTSTPYPTRTPRPTSTPWPTPTPSATRPSRPTPSATPVGDSEAIAGVVATFTSADPEPMVAAVATFAARTNAALQPLIRTPGP